VRHRIVRVTSALLIHVYIALFCILYLLTLALEATYFCSIIHVAILMGREKVCLGLNREDLFNLFLSNSSLLTCSNAAYVGYPTPEDLMKEDDVITAEPTETTYLCAPRHPPDKNRI